MPSSARKKKCPAPRQPVAHFLDMLRPPPGTTLLPYTTRFRSGEARASLARAAAWAPAFPDAREMAAFYEGMLASATGDKRAALAARGAAGRRAGQIGRAHV